MLEKNSNIIYYDAHFHYCDSINSETFIKNNYISGCTTALNQNDWYFQETCDEKFLKSYGIHPQNVSISNLENELTFIENLIHQNKLKIIGEIGFDFFNEKDRNNKELQSVFFISQIELAIKYNLPVIIHCRKANEKLFEYSNLLKKLPSVLLHSFMGNSLEAQSLLNKNVNYFFSFGKQMMNNNKKVIDCVINLPIEKLLLETDAPFQTLKNETKTLNTDITKIYDYAQKLRNQENEGEFFKIIKNNYEQMFII